MRDLISIIIIAFCFSTIPSYAILAQDQNSSIASFLPRPEELGKWHLVDSARTFVGEDLFTFIDGGADVYYEYGFKQVITAEYRDNHDLSIKLEIYEMANDAASSGMYSISASIQGKKIIIGNEGTISEYYLIFWKDRFLIFISSDDTTKATSTEMLSIASSIDKKIPKLGEKPTLLKYLPKQGLSVSKYFKGLLGLSSIYIFDTKNIFGVKEGVVGIYQTHNLFIFNYDSDKVAIEEFRNALGALKTSKRFFNFKEYTRLCSMTDQKDYQICVSHLNNLIVIVVAQPKNDAVAIHNDVITSIQNR